MNKRIKLNALLSLLLALSLFLSMPVYVLAEEPEEIINSVEETFEETADEPIEAIPEMIYEPFEPVVEDAGEGPFNDPDVEIFAEENVSEEPQALDLDQALDDMSDDSAETADALMEEEGDEDALQASDVQEEPIWSLSLPGSQAIAYKAEKTKIGTIAVKDALHFTDGQAICVTLYYSSFHSDTYSIPIEITVIQNGIELIWSDGVSCFLNPDGSDPIEVFVNISAEEWAAAPHGAYAMSLIFNSALSGR